MKICKKCGEEKAKSEFHFDNRLKDGISSFCKNCHYNISWENTLHRQFNLTVKQYEMMLKTQNGVCTICGQLETVKQLGKIKRLTVDHCHKTGKIRGLLCHKCNSAIDYFNDSSKLLRKAADYLEKYQ